MRKIIVIPAVFIGCLIVIWIATVAAAKMPAQEIMAPTLTAVAENSTSKNLVEPVSKVPAAGLENENCVLSLHFPAEIQQWCALIEGAAQDTRLPASLIAAVMLQESGGNPTAISHSGAVGLMQVMPRDGKAAEFMCVNGPCFASRPTTEELLDPALNITYGSQLLADLYAKYGTYREALYKYGPMDMGYRYADLVLNIWNNYN
jgi:soluble lytic murein transglycosylase-like protein